MIAVVLAESTFARTIDLKDRAKLSCYIFDDWTFFDLRALQKQDGAYHFKQNTTELVWNFCDYVDIPADWIGGPVETFAYVNESNAYHELTSSSLETDSQTMVAKETDQTWVKFTQTSDTTCKADPS